MNESQLLNKARDFKKSGVCQNSTEMFYKFTETFRIEDIPEFQRKHAMTELLKFFGIQGVSEIALLDQISEPNFNERQWDDICNSILQSVRSKSNE